MLDDFLRALHMPRRRLYIDGFLRGEKSSRRLRAGIFDFVSLCLRERIKDLEF
jgi:hypothetical protein